MLYECSDEGTCTLNIRNSSTRSHASEGENRTRNRSKNCKCKQALRIYYMTINQTLGRQEHCHKTVLLAPFEFELLQSTTAPFLHSWDMGEVRARSGINEGRISTLDWLSQCLSESTNQIEHS